MFKNCEYEISASEQKCDRMIFFFKYKQVGNI